MIFRQSLKLRSVLCNKVRCPNAKIFPSTFNNFENPLSRGLSSYKNENVINEVRDSLSLVTNPVHVIGCKGEQGFNGITVSSVTSLSLSPLPLLTFNIRLPSSFSTTLHEAIFCSVNTLSTTQTEIATLLSRPKATLHNHDIQDIFFQDPDTGIPFLKDSLVSFLCKIHSTLVVADHEIWVVEPIKTTFLESQISSSTKNRVGLLYGNRRFLKAPSS